MVTNLTCFFGLCQGQLSNPAGAYFGFAAKLIDSRYVRFLQHVAVYAFRCLFVCGILTHTWEHFTRSFPYLYRGVRFDPFNGQVISTATQLVNSSTDVAPDVNVESSNLATLLT